MIIQVIGDKRKTLITNGLKDRFKDAGLDLEFAKLMQNCRKGSRNEVTEREVAQVLVREGGNIEGTVKSFRQN